MKKTQSHISIILILLVCSTGLFSCNIWEKINSETVHTETVKEFYRDTTIYVPSDAVVSTMDSSWKRYLDSKLQSSKDTVFVNSKGGQTVLKYYINDSGDLAIECEKKDQEIKALLKQIERQSKTDKKTEVTKQKKMPRKIKIALGLIAAALVLVVGARAFMR